MSPAAETKARDMERIVGFLHRIEAGSATRVEPCGCGRAFFNDKFPVKWDMNYVRIEDDDGADASLIASEVERVQGEAGLEHRKIHVDDETLGSRLSPDFAELGWKVTRIVAMARYRLDKVRAAPVEISEMTSRELRPAMEAWDRNKHDISQDEVDQLAGARDHLMDVVKGTNFAAHVDGKIAGWCEYYTDGELAQVENVCTFEEYRNRGVASSVIMAGIERAEADGTDLVFLLADEEDWPKALYEKLGFEAVGYIYEFLKTKP